MWKWGITISNITVWKVFSEDGVFEQRHECYEGSFHSTPQWALAKEKVCPQAKMNLVGSRNNREVHWTASL